MQAAGVMRADAPRCCCCRVMEQVAQLVGAPLDHPSRAQAALQACLRRACQADSHTHLPWPQLQLLALQLMSQTVDRGWPAGPEGLAMAAVDLMVGAWW